jgi:hypothetical protein
MEITSEGNKSMIHKLRAVCVTDQAVQEFDNVICRLVAYDYKVTIQDNDGNSVIYGPTKEKDIKKK